VPEPLHENGLDAPNMALQKKEKILAVYYAVVSK